MDRDILLCVFTITCSVKTLYFEVPVFEAVLRFSYDNIRDTLAVPICPARCFNARDDPAMD